jgi:hypothetical protein
MQSSKYAASTGYYYTAPISGCVMYRVHRVHLSALRPTLVALAARPKKHQPPTEEEEGVFSFQYNSQYNSQCNSHTGQKSAITEFRTSWGGLISRLLVRSKQFTSKGLNGYVLRPYPFQ